MFENVVRTATDSYFVITELSPGGAKTWACIVVDSQRWVLHVHSEYGSWAYNWHQETDGRTFKKLLAEMHDEYLLRKLCSKRPKVFNCEKTVAKLKDLFERMDAEAIMVRGKLGHIPFNAQMKAVALEKLRVAEEEHSNSGDLFVWTLVEELPWLYRYAADGLAVREDDPQCAEFLKLLWPLFITELKKEIASA